MMLSLPRKKLSRVVFLLSILAVSCKSRDAPDRDNSRRNKYVRRNKKMLELSKGIIDEDTEYWTRFALVSSSMTISPTTSSLPSGTPTTSSPTIPPTSSPTFPCNTSPEEREKSLLAIAASVSNESLVTDDSTPQGQALNWLVNVDQLVLCHDDVADVVQRYVTAVFYLSIGASTSDKLPTTHECDWPGITCNSLDVVSQIKFEENLGGTIPSEIIQLSGLLVLKIEDSKISGSIPTNIGLLGSLLSIDLNVNEMTGSLPDSLYELSNLQQLDLDTNLFTGSLAANIDDLKNLRFLQLENNSFTGAIPVSLGNINVLEQATFDQNQFTGDMPNSVCSNRGDGNLGGPLIVLNADCPPQFSCDCCTIICP